MPSRPKRLVGVDISDRSIEIVELEDRRIPQVRSLGRITLPEGIVSRGEIRIDGALDQALRETLRSAVPGLPSVKDAVCNIPEEQIYLRRLELKTGTPEELKIEGSKAVREFVPYQPDKLVWDALPVGGGGSYGRALLVAVPKRTFELYRSAMKSAGFESYGFGFDSMALAESFFGGHSDPPALVLDIGSRTTVVAVIDDLGVHSSMNVASGGDTMTKALAAKMGLSEEEAEAVKRRHGFDPEAEQGKVFLVLQKSLQPIMDMVTDMVEEYRSETGNAPGQVILSGGTSALFGLDEYVASVLELPVTRGKIIGGADLGALPARTSEAFEAVPGLFAVAFGLAKSGFRLDTPLFANGGREVADTESKAGQSVGVSVGAPSPGSIAQAAEAGPRVVRRIRKTIRGVPKWKVAAVTAIWLGLMGAGTYLYLQQASSKPAPPGAATAAPAAAGAPVEVKQLKFNAVLRFSGESQPGDIPAGSDTIERDGEQDVQLTDTQPSGRSAGTVTIANSQNIAQPLVAGTRISSPDGLIFRLSDAVSVPAGGTIAGVKVTADADGAAYDLAPTTFTIPGLPADRRGSVKVTSDIAFAGGGESGIITADALDAAEKTLRDTLRSAAMDAFAGRTIPDTVSSGAIAIEREVSSSTPPLGRVAANAAKVSLTMSYSMPYVATADLLSAGRVAAADELGSAQAVSAYSFSDWAFTVDQVLNGGDSANATITAQLTKGQ